MLRTKLLRCFFNSDIVREGRNIPERSIPISVLEQGSAIYACVYVEEAFKMNVFSHAQPWALAHRAILNRTRCCSLRWRTSPFDTLSPICRYVEHTRLLVGTAGHTEWIVPAADGADLHLSRSRARDVCSHNKFLRVSPARYARYTAAAMLSRAIGTRLSNVSTILHALHAARSESMIREQRSSLRLISRGGCATQLYFSFTRRLLFHLVRICTIYLETHTRGLEKNHLKESATGSTKTFRAALCLAQLGEMICLLRPGQFRIF